MKNRMKYTGDIVVLSALLLAASFARPATAQEDDLEELLNTGLEILMDIQVVTPSRKGQTIVQAPANITVITAETIRRHGYQTLEEVLRDVPGFEFTTSQPAGEYPTHFIFRGIADVGQTKTLIMIDGVVQNDVSNGWARGLGYDFILSDVEMIEVISGPGSALYGANAYAGIINLITKAPEDGPPGLDLETGALIGAHQTLTPEFSLRYKSADDLSFRLAGRYFHSDGDGGLGRPDPGLYFRGNAEPEQVLTTEYGDIANERTADGATKALPDGFRTHIDDLYLRGKIQKGRFAIDFTYWDKEEGLGSEVVGYEYFANSPGLNYGIHHRGYSVQAQHDAELKRDLSSKTRLYFRSNQILPKTGFFYTYKYQSVDNGIDPKVEDKLKGYHGEGYIAGIEQQFNADLSPDQSIVWGLQLEQEIKQYFGISLGPQQQASSTIIRSAYTSEEEVVQPIFFSKNAALFVQDQYRLGENYTFTGGLRFDMDDEYGQVLNPRLTLVRSPQVGFGFKMLYGRAFKAPTVFELFDEFRGNERLNPEKIATGEIEFNYRIGRAALLKASFYYSKLTDIILVAPNPDPSRVPIGPNSEYLDYYQNIGSTSIRGFTLSADYQLNRSLSYYGNYAFTAGKDSDPLDNTARHKVNLGLDYSWAQKADLSLRANWRGQVKAPISNRYFQAKTAATIAEVGYDYMTESSPDGYMDGELLMHLTLSLYPLSDRLPLTPQFIVKNALNTQYAGIGRQSGSGVRPIDQPQIQNPSGFIPPYHPQPGREIFFVLRYDFSQR